MDDGEGRRVERDWRHKNVCFLDLCPPFALLHPAIAVVQRACRCELGSASIDPSDTAGGCTLGAAAWWNPRASSTHARLIIQATMSKGKNISSGVFRMEGARW